MNHDLCLKTGKQHLRGIGSEIILEKKVNGLNEIRLNVIERRKWERFYMHWDSEKCELKES